MKKKVIIVIVLILIILLFPIKTSLYDGGSIKYKSIVYSITKLNRLNGINKREKGTIIKVFGYEIYNKTWIESDNMNNYNKNEIVINGKTYSVTFEDNDSVKELFSLNNLEFEMNDLNNNEKYVYLNASLKTNSYKPKHIESGDIMLYGDNCLVIFYKSFDTVYSYTYLGHINDLDKLDSNKINVLFK